MIFLEATLKIAPGKQREFNELLRSRLVPLNEKTGMKLVAAYANITGVQDVVTDLWAYDDLAQMQRSQETLAGEAEWRDIFRTLQTLIAWENTRLLTPLRYHPADGLTPRADQRSVLMSARLRVNAGRMGEFLKTFANDFLPVAQRNGMQLVGAYQTTTGPLAEVLDLWRFDSVAAYGEVTRALAGDPDFRRLVQEIRSIAPDENISLHVPLPYSPFR